MATNDFLQQLGKRIDKKRDERLEPWEEFLEKTGIDGILADLADGQITLEVAYTRLAALFGNAEVGELQAKVKELEDALAASDKEKESQRKRADGLQDSLKNTRGNQNNQRNNNPKNNQQGGAQQGSQQKEPGPIKKVWNLATGGN